MTQLVMQILISYSCYGYLCLETTECLCRGHPHAGTHTCMGGTPVLFSMRVAVVTFSFNMLGCSSCPVQLVTQV